MINGLSHIGIAVEDIQNTLLIFEQFLGLQLVEIKESKQHKIKAALLKAGDTKIELLEPLNNESPIFKFLKKRGQGIHHIAFKVDNIEKMLVQLKANGVALIDETPRVGIEGKKIAFLHPNSTSNVLVELCEH